MTDSKNMLDVAALNPDYLGFIFYPPSKRDVTNKIGQLPLKDLSSSVEKVAVMVDAPLEEAMARVQNYRFELVQLHGNESPAYCNSLKKYAKVIKTFSIQDTIPEQINSYKDEVDFFLLDTFTPEGGGSGKSFNHQILENAYIPKPWFLAGGISSSNTKTIAEQQWHNLHALDLNSKFESEPGIKNIELLNTFFNQIEKR